MVAVANVILISEETNETWQYQKVKNNINPTTKNKTLGTYAKMDNPTIIHIYYLACYYLHPIHSYHNLWLFEEHSSSFDSGCMEVLVAAW